MSKSQTLRAQVALMRELSKTSRQMSAETVTLEDAGAFSAVANELDNRADFNEALMALHVAEVPANATPDEVFQRRIDQAVRRGTDTYLPFWPADSFGFPSMILRSAFFDASRRRVVLSGDIAASGNVTITIQGTSMDGMDLRVYGHCLNAYQEGPRPLAANENAEWFYTSFRQFVEMMGKRYSRETHEELRESLDRLKTANVTFRWTRKVSVRGETIKRQMEVVLERLVEVITDEAVDSKDNLVCRGDSEIRFRISADTADLFGYGDWTRIEKKFFAGRQGLSLWIGAFIRSHTQPWWYDVDKLQAMSSSQANRVRQLSDSDEMEIVNCRTDFRRRLENALIELKSDSVPESMRIEDYKFRKIGPKKWQVIFLKNGWTEEQALNNTLPPKVLEALAKAAAKKEKAKARAKAKAAATEHSPEGVAAE